MNTTNTPRAIELAAQLTREWHNDALNYDTALNAADELRRLAAVEAERDALRAELERIKGLQPMAWMMNWPGHSPSFTTDKSDYASWFAGKVSYPDQLVALYALPPFDLTQTKEPTT